MDVSVEVPVVEEHDSNTGHLYTYVEEAKELEEFMRETVESPEKRKQRERFDRFGLIVSRSHSMINCVIDSTIKT